MILCFSGTGNSRYCADFLAHHLDDQVLDLFSYIHCGIAADLISGKPWVVVCPTYAWQLPHLVRDFLRGASLSGSEEIYFVMTCGSDIGDAPRKNEALCDSLGLTCMGTQEVIMPENYIAMFDAPEQPEALSIISAAIPVLEETAAKIAAGEVLEPHAPRKGDRVKSGPVNRLFYPLFVRDRAFTVSDACIHCGKCVDGCITANIHLTDGKPVWEGHCTHCMACICRCPAGAIEYGTKSLGKPRYQCPTFSKS